MQMSIRTVTLGVATALAVLCLPSLASADPISVGDGWHSFSWTGGPNAVQTQSAFTFTTAAAVTVNVTDAYVAGDRFQLTDNGKLVGTTSQYNGGTPWTDNPDVAWAGGATTGLLGGFSKATFTLAAGTHSLVLKDIQIPFNLDSGAAYFRVVGTDGGGGVVASVAPEPGTLVLVGMGLAGMGLARVRRRRAEVAAA